MAASTRASAHGPARADAAMGALRDCVHTLALLLTAAFRYILEGRELEFYVKKMQKKKGKQ